KSADDSGDACEVDSALHRRGGALADAWWAEVTCPETQYDVNRAAIGKPEGGRCRHCARRTRGKLCLYRGEWGSQWSRRADAVMERVRLCGGGGCRADEHTRQEDHRAQQDCEDCGESLHAP